MKRLAQTFALSVLGCSVLFVSVAEVNAGCGGGGGYHRSSSYHRSHGHSYNNYRHAPSYHRQPAVRISTCPTNAPPQFAPQPGVPQQPQQFAPQQGAPQQFAGQPQQGQQPQQQQFAQPQQAQRPTQPAQQPQQVQQPQQAQPAPQAAPGNAQQSALQMLSSFGAEPTPQQQAQEPQANGRVGTWTAKLPNNATVQLNLQAAGTFTWTATANGKTSSFNGSYNINGESLTLTRQDGQKLSGSLTNAAANQFTFKLAGGKDNGLTFARG